MNADGPEERPSRLDRLARLPMRMCQSEQRTAEGASDGTALGGRQVGRSCKRGEQPSKARFRSYLVASSLGRQGHPVRLGEASGTADDLGRETPRAAQCQPSQHVEILEHAQ